MRSFSVLVIAAIASTSSLAADKVLIAPVQGGDIVEPDLMIEVEEAIRAGAMKRAHDLGLLVMSHKTLARSLDDLRKGDRDKVIGLPCKDAQCDAGLGRALGTQLAVSTRLTKIDGKYLALMRVVSTETDKVIATSSVETDTFGSLLGEVTKQAERMMGDGRAATPKPVVERKLRAGTITITREGEMLGSTYACDLSTTHLRCKTVGLFASGQKLVIPLAEVTSVFPESSGRIALDTKGSTYKIGMLNFKEADQKAGVYEKELERQRITVELAAWKTDLDAAWSALNPR